MDPRRFDQLARGATPGPCGNPGAGRLPFCQRALGGVCTATNVGVPGCCDRDLLCTSTVSVVVTACQLPCDADADCRATFPHTRLVCRKDLAVCPFLDKCCVPPV